MEKEKDFTEERNKGLDLAEKYKRERHYLTARFWIGYADAYKQENKKENPEKWIAKAIELIGEFKEKKQKGDEYYWSGLKFGYEQRR
jgi:hypothetical protein